MVYKYLMMVFELKRRQLDDPLLETTYYQGGFFFSKEPLVCGPQRTLYPSLIGNIVLYTSLLTCLLMFTMDYKSLMMLPE
jgi:hypothetical protein